MIILEILKIHYYLVVAYFKTWFFVNPYYVIIHAYHETGAFDSSIYKENKNYFGMKKPSIRDHLVIGKNRGHGVFQTYQDSVTDLLMYLKHMGFENGDYFQFLKNQNYFTDNSYLEKVHAVGQKIEHYIYFVWILLGIALYLIFKKL
jgi:uncharacterized FlgJ-related protein